MAPRTVARRNAGDARIGTNLNAAGSGQAVCMSISGHKTASTFLRYNITQPEVEEDGFERLDKHLAKERETAPSPTPLAVQEQTR